MVDLKNNQCEWDESKHGGKPCPTHNGGNSFNEKRTQFMSDEDKKMLIGKTFKEEKNKLSPEQNKAVLEMKQNKYFKEVANAIEKGMFENGYQLTNNDKQFFVDMFYGKAKADDIVKQDCYKWVEQKSNDLINNHSLDINDEKNAEIVNKAEQEFYDIITKGKTGDEFKGNSLTIVTGLPASGKSSGLVKPYLEKGIELDSDICKKVPALSEYFAGGIGTGAVHEASKRIMDRVTKRLISEGYNIVLPIIGPDLQTIGKKIDVFMDNGYEAGIICTQLPNEQSRLRCFKRYVEEGRFIDDSVVKGYGDNPSKAYNELKEANGIINYEKKNKDGSKYAKQFKVNII